MGLLKESLKLFADSVLTSYHQNEPRIKIFAGVAGLVAAGVWACVSTAKNHDILEEADKEIEKIKEEKKDAPEEEVNADIFKVKAKAGGKVILNYAGPAALAIVSGGTIISGEKEYKARNLLGVAAMREAERKYDTLIGRIENKYGPKVKDELLHDIKQVRKDETVEDPETGKKKSRRVTKNEVGEDVTPGFKLRLDRYNWKLWQPDFDTNINTLFGIQSELQNNLMRMVAFNRGNGAVITASDILRTIEFNDIDDIDIKKGVKDKGCVWTPDHPIDIDFGLKQAQELKDFSVYDEKEIILHINFVDNVWSYR